MCWRNSRPSRWHSSKGTARGCRGPRTGWTRGPSYTAPLTDVPLSRKPSAYFLDQCYISVDVDEYLVTDVIGRLGDDNIVISTDYPHIDAHYPHAVEEFMETPGLSNSSLKKILWDNFARLYGVG